MSPHDLWMWIVSKWEVLLSLPKRWQEYREAKHHADKAKVEVNVAKEQLAQAKIQTTVDTSNLAEIERENEIRAMMNQMRPMITRGGAGPVTANFVAGPGESQEIVDETWRRLQIEFDTRLRGTTPPFSR
jgi:hypothetical protein